MDDRQKPAVVLEISPAIPVPWCACILSRQHSTTTTLTEPPLRTVGGISGYHQMLFCSLWVVHWYMFTAPPWQHDHAGPRVHGFMRGCFPGVRTGERGPGLMNSRGKDGEYQSTVFPTYQMGGDDLGVANLTGAGKGVPPSFPSLCPRMLPRSYNHADTYPQQNGALAFRPRSSPEAGV